MTDFDEYSILAMRSSSLLSSLFSILCYVFMMLNVFSHNVLTLEPQLMVDSTIYNFYVFNMASIFNSSIRVMLASVS